MRDEAGRDASNLPVCLGLSGSNTSALLDTLDANRGVADRRLPDFLPLLFAAVAARAASCISTRWPIAPPSRSLLYNIPYRTGVNLGNETMLRLAGHPNIVGLKDCCADRNQSLDLLRRRPAAAFAVLTGEDAQYHEALTDGADGGILASAHIETETLRGICADAACRRRSRRRTVALGERFADLTRLLFAEPSPRRSSTGCGAPVDRQRRSAAADDGSERGAGGAARCGRSSGVRCIAPSPRSCGERVGVRGSLDRLGLADSPPHPKFAIANFDLSPHAGRGKTAQSSRVRASRSALAITLTDDSAIAAAPTIGDSRMPNTG